MSEEKEKIKNCFWTQEDIEDGHYKTSCERDFWLEDGTPSENGMEFCCFCGYPIEEILFVSDDDEEEDAETEE